MEQGHQGMEGGAAVSATWQWAKANPDAAARLIRELERENAALRAKIAELEHFLSPKP